MEAALTAPPRRGRAARALAWPSNRLALAIGVLGTLAIIVLDACVRDAPTPQGDDLIYARMADDPTAPHTFVFAYRVAVPWLVHVLPFDHGFSFSAIAWLCSGAAGAVLFLLLERLAISRRVSVPLAFVLVLSPPLLVASLRQGYNPDPLTVLVMVTGTLFIVERRLVPLALTMLVGALNRESALFLAPLAYAVWAQRPLDRAALARVLAVAAPAVAAFCALRLAIPTVGRELVPGYGASLIGGRVEVLGDGLRAFFDVEARRLALIYGPLWLLAPLALRDFWFARRGLVLVPLCLIAMTFALDWGRVAFIAAPVVYAAAAWTLQQRPRLLAPALALCALMIVAYAAYMQFVGTQNIIDAGPPPYPVR
ncbi:MAG: hypothetical protein KY463_05665 [Actinobacteria bacterium]|nr:hypothetical protein [Actinomycetota bacterium]